jgi:hypothetical protein
MMEGWRCLAHSPSFRVTPVSDALYDGDRLNFMKHEAGSIKPGF